MRKAPRKLRHPEWLFTAPSIKDTLEEGLSLVFPFTSFPLGEWNSRASGSPLEASLILPSMHNLLFFYKHYFQGLRQSWVLTRLLLFFAGLFLRYPLCAGHHLSPPALSQTAIPFLFLTLGQRNEKKTTCSGWNVSIHSQFTFKLHLIFFYPIW